jgi:hypothetical protein
MELKSTIWPMAAPMLGVAEVAEAVVYPVGNPTAMENGHV